MRLSGEKAEYTGVVAGMSGSPVYLNGKLAGALAFRIGEFSKEPIAGVTPIAEMLEINAMDRSPGSSTVNAESAVACAHPNFRAWSRDYFDGLAAKDYANYLKPIEAPLVFSGFSQEAMQRFAPQFAKAGIVPVMGVGSVSESKQPEPLEPGSAISAILVRGDMDIAATCTVTYMDAQHLLACGHPLLQFGMVDLPMTKAEVLATLPSPLNAFKIVNATEPVGAFVQDRHTGIMGEFGKQPEMIPVTLEYSRRGGEQTISLRSAEQRQPESGGHDGHGVQRAARRERVRRGHHLSHERPDQRERISRRHGAEHVCAVRRRTAGRGHGGALAGGTFQPHLRQSVQRAWHSRRPA